MFILIKRELIPLIMGKKIYIEVSQGNHEIHIQIDLRCRFC